MTTFKNAALSGAIATRTTNGMKAISTTLSDNLDLFYKIGASRGKDLSAEFERAYQEDRDMALRIALYARDVRGGAGEREVFKKLLNYLTISHPKDLIHTRFLNKVPELGRWDDLFVTFGSNPTVEQRSLSLIKDALQDGNGLAAKWMPRKGQLAAKLRYAFGWTPKYYRKRLVELTNVVETQMCAKDWSSINFNHVPSLAMSRYLKAFSKNAGDSFVAYRESLVKGEAKVNAAAVYPYDVIKSLRSGGDRTVCDVQWNMLPDYIDDTNVLSIVDVSGSMHTPAGGNPNVQAIDVALSLGLYTADKNKGAFKDMFLTFSGESELLVLKGGLTQKLQQMSTSKWAMNTNINKAFEKILAVATEHSVPDSEMPKMLLILSDMQFDQCARFDDSAMQMIRRKYQSAGYELPVIVFWNLRDAGNMPVRCDARGVVMVSGFSPAVMKSVLSADLNVTPESMLRETIGVERYNYL